MQLMDNLMKEIDALESFSYENVVILQRQVFFLLM